MCEGLWQGPAQLLLIPQRAVLTGRGADGVTSGDPQLLPPYRPYRAWPQSPRFVLGLVVLLSSTSLLQKTRLVAAFSPGDVHVGEHVVTAL